MKKLKQGLKAISIHDGETIAAEIRRQFGVSHVAMLPQIQRMAHQRYLKHIGQRSKYTPHQGIKEAARRLRQIRVAPCL